MKLIETNMIGNLHFNYSDLRAEAIRVYCYKKGISIHEARSETIMKYINRNQNSNLYDAIYSKIDNLKDIDMLFESTFTSEDVEANGIVFTPEYIVEYIVENTIDLVSKDIKILDPACGCGSFLLPVIEKLHSQFSFSIKEIVENIIFGFDINEDNIENIRILIALKAMEFGEFEHLNDNLFCVDSLDDNQLSKLEANDIKFDYIIGNPPYINNHSLSDDYVVFLRNNYSTTTKGVFNIFYAFIEKYYKWLSHDGKLTYIIPNNWFVISSAEPLRDFFIKTQSICKLVDFTSNLVFNPVKTYNSIIFLDNKPKESFSFGKLNFTKYIEKELDSISFSIVDYKYLSTKTWNLIANEERLIINKIESFNDKLGNYIKTGIATLSDKLYMIDKRREEGEYYLITTSEKREFKIEKCLVKKLIKISKNANEEAIKETPQGIIFPYKRVGRLFEIINEDEMMECYPEAYQYFAHIRPLLAKRNSDNPNSREWYRYGRSQGVNNYGLKLVFPTFSKRPRFVLDVEEDSLFCNGYAVFIDGNSYYCDYPIALKNILNSSVMDYYISKTSYSIEGDYKCYQKKYVADFSIPNLNLEEVEELNVLVDQYKIDKFVMKIYGISFLR